MSLFGEMLRQARESQGISIHQAAMETHIMQQSLIALEEGNIENLSNDVVIKGFLRNYATYLNLSPNDIIELYRRERNQNTDSIRVIPATHLIQQRSYVFPSFFGVFFVTIALIGLAYVVLNMTGYLQNSRYADYQQPVESVSIPPTPTPFALATPLPLFADSTDPITQPHAIIPTEQAQPAASDDDLLRMGEPTSFALSPATPRPAAGGVLPIETPIPTPEYPIVVQLVMTPNTADSWLRVTVDGVVAFEGIMRSGEQNIYQAQQYVHVRAGNPPVVNIGVNGAPPKPLGTNPGDPVNWYWPPDPESSWANLE